MNDFIQGFNAVNGPTLNFIGCVVGFLLPFAAVLLVIIVIAVIVATITGAVE